MRRSPFILVSILLAAVGVAGVAQAGGDSGSPAAAVVRASAPFTAPVQSPRADREQSDTWVFRPAQQIAAGLQPHGGRPHVGRPGSVRVTATVLPCVILVVDAAARRVVTIATNTPTRDARRVVYLVRRGQVSGPSVPMTATIWRSARTALSRTDAGTGIVWSE